MRSTAGHSSQRVTGPESNCWRISVRELVEFALRSGDLAGRGLFRPGRAWQGVQGHQRIQKSRPSGYRAEVWLSHRVAGPVAFELRGRVDGIWPTGDGVVIEEIKTTAGGEQRVEPDAVHWGQAMVYAFLYATAEKLEALDVQLTYLDLDTEESLVFRRRQTKAELAGFFDGLLRVFAKWAELQTKWLRVRNAALEQLQFPHAEFRPGQKRVAAAPFKILKEGGKIFVEAPTGIGKTISFLFAALKALGLGGYEKILYLTATSVGRGIAEGTIEEMRRRSGLRIRSLTLTARDKICFGPDIPCDAQRCPFALGYYDRLQGALADALGREALTRPVIEEMARAHGVCPFAFSMDLLPWVEVVICDYNYAFDPSAQLRGFLEEHTHALLVDEAHNLVERGRAMFSARMAAQELSGEELEAQDGKCKRALRELRGFIEEWAEGCANDADAAGYLKELPERLLALVRKAQKLAEESLMKNGETASRAALLERYFVVNRFARAADWYDERFVCLLESEGDGPDGPAIKAACLDPAALLRRMSDRAWAVLFFSATLSPLDYFRESLGGELGDDMLRVASPFAAENLQVLAADRIPTYYRARRKTGAQVSTAIAELVKSRTGNYLVYFPSYAYLEEVRALFQDEWPDAVILSQRPGMSEEERLDFLSAFQAAPEKTVIGFAVLGGLFGEGIDLVGDRLIGTVVVGVGLPQVSLERNLMRAYFQEKNGRGFEFAYQFPGMNRVLQAAGRVIRSKDDRGLVLLIDARFAEERYRELFPPGWNVLQVDADIGEAARRFWNGG